MKILERFSQIVRAQLTQGATPEGLALSCAVGVMAGNCPLFGLTTILAAGAGFFLKLNHPVLQLANYLMFASQLILIPVFLWIGETLTGADHLSLNPVELKDRLGIDGPVLFLQKFGMAAAHATLAWILIAPFMGTITYLVMRFFFRRLLPLRK